MKFLSPEWVAQLDQQLKASGLCLSASAASSQTNSLDGASEHHSNFPDTICIQSIVRLPDAQPSLCYFITMDADRATASSGLAATPDLTLSQTWAVASAIAQGQRDAHEAFLMGEIKVTGDVTKLLPLADIALQVQQISAAVNQQTVF